MRFASLLSRVTARASERAFGETIRITPAVASPYAMRAADPSRPAATVRAIVSFENADGTFEGGRRGSQMQGATVITRRPSRAYLTHATYASLVYALAAGDIIELIDADADRSGERYAITRVVHTDTGDVILEMAISDEVLP
jgi:hypothetical protein